MSINSNHCSILINKISESKEISYYELKKYFDEKQMESSQDEFKDFELNEELDNLEEIGVIRFDEGLIIYEGF